MWDFLIILVGSCFAQVLFRNKAIEDRLITFYKRFQPDAKESKVAKVEYTFLPLFGALVAYSIHSPETVISQIAVGFSWSATFEAFLKKS